jgi:hypothetical protein
MIHLLAVPRPPNSALIRLIWSNRGVVLDLFFGRPAFTAHDGLVNTPHFVHRKVADRAGKAESVIHFSHKSGF